MSNPIPTAVEVAIAGHSGDSATARAGLSSSDTQARRAALFALARLNELTPQDLEKSLCDDDTLVRRAAAELSSQFQNVNLITALDDDEYLVAEMAAWACGEHESVSDDILEKLIQITQHHEHQLVREAAAAALGAIGDIRGLPAILTACNDKPAVRRRAVLALAPFEGPEVDAAIEKALTDKDWQVRQSAEDLLHS